VRKLGMSDLKGLLVDLGIQPSDIFLANNVLLVEGKTEDQALPRLAGKVGLDISDLSVVPIHGKSKGKYHLQVWLEAAKNTNLGGFLLLDGDAETEYRRALSEKLIDRDHALVLRKRDFAAENRAAFEDFLPKSSLAQAIAEKSGNPVNEVQARLKDTQPVSVVLEEIFGAEVSKPALAIRAIELAPAGDLAKESDELIRYLRKIRAQIGR